MSPTGTESDADRGRPPGNARDAGALAADAVPAILGDAFLLWTLLVVGLVPMAIAIARHETWGAEPSIGLVIALFSGWGIVSHCVRAARRTEPNHPHTERVDRG